MQILLVEDDKRIAEFIIKGLVENGFQVEWANSGESAKSLLQEYDFDLMILDIMLPGIDGFQLTQLLRFKQINIPILILSALSDPDDKVMALDSGADDYLVKPFHFNELVSRINALTRRRNFNQQLDKHINILICGQIQIFVDEHKVLKGTSIVELSPKEYKLLLFLLQRKNKVVSRTQILSAVWNINFDNNTNVVDVYISYLRAKLEDDDFKFINTIKGAGYLVKD